MSAIKKPQLTDNERNMQRNYAQEGEEAEVPRPKVGSRPTKPKTSSDPVAKSPVSNPPLTTTTNAVTPVPQSKTPSKTPTPANTKSTSVTPKTTPKPQPPPAVVLQQDPIIDEEEQGDISEDYQASQQAPEDYQASQQMPEDYQASQQMPEDELVDLGLDDNFEVQNRQLSQVESQLPPMTQIQPTQEDIHMDEKVKEAPVKKNKNLPKRKKSLGNSESGSSDKSDKEKMKEKMKEDKKRLKTIKGIEKYMEYRRTVNRSTPCKWLKYGIGMVNPKVRITAPCLASLSVILSSLEREFGEYVGTAMCISGNGKKIPRITDGKIAILLENFQRIDPAHREVERLFRQYSRHLE